MIYTPENLQELQQRCQQIRDKSIGHLADELQIQVPANLLQAKGWMGQLLELYLGATGGSNAIHDFPELGVELKTIPVNTNLKPLESTYVCTVNLNETALNWHDSWVYNKLKHVLWVPVLATKELPINERKILTPFLWKMDAKTEDILRTDWEELMEMMVLGNGAKITAKYGTFLHIRPKAANSKVLIDYQDNDGNRTKIVPKGFYLRPNFQGFIASVTV